MRPAHATQTSEIAEETTPPSNQRAHMPLTLLAYLGLDLALAVSALMPWEDYGSYGATGVALARGWPVLITAGVAGCATVVSIVRDRPIRYLRLIQGATAAVALSMFAIEFTVLWETCDQLTAWRFNQYGHCVELPLGTGAIVAMSGGVALGLLAVFRK